MQTSELTQTRLIAVKPFDWRDFVENATSESLCTLAGTRGRVAEITSRAANTTFEELKAKLPVDLSSSIIGRALQMLRLSLKKSCEARNKTNSMSFRSARFGELKSSI